MLSLTAVNIFIVLFFVAGYIFITLEHLTKINKATVALLMAVFCWLLQFLSPICCHEENVKFLGEHLASISQVVFFLLGALAVVEIMSVHKSFGVISNAIQISSRRKLLWISGILTFFLSSVLDNMTTTIVMVSLMSQLLDKGEDRWIIGGGIVIAANAGGAWTPIGDVTTTMLWIGGQLSTLSILRSLFLPSLTCFAVSFGILSLKLKGDFPARRLHLHEQKSEPLSSAIFFLGLASLVFVPCFKLLTGMPPFMGMLFGLGILWLITDLVHAKYEDREHLRVPNILSKIDLSGILFFFGILLAIDALETAGLLKGLANWLDRTVSQTGAIAFLIGLFSSVVDNVPLVAASMSMYDLTRFPVDHSFWEMVAYAAGTGGSILIIGSAAGVVFMGLEKVYFSWYLKHIALAAFIGYLAGFAVYIIS